MLVLLNWPIVAFSRKAFLASDIFETLQSAIYLHQRSRNLYKVSNHSPLLNQKMIPFMSSVTYSPLLNQKMIPFMSSITCLFEPVDSPVSEHEQHQNRLTDIVESWGFSCTLYQGMEHSGVLGFQLHPVPGDGTQWSPGVSVAPCTRGWNIVESWGFSCSLYQGMEHSGVLGLQLHPVPGNGT